MGKNDPIYVADRNESPLLIGLWRWYAPATLKNVGDDSDLIPVSAVETLLRDVGFQSVEDLTRHLRPFKRGEIPDSLQNKLTRIFKVDTGFLDNDLEFLIRPIVIDYNGKTVRIPYPLLPTQPVTADIVVAAFRITTVKGSSVRISMRIGVATNDFLAPRSTADEKFCQLFVVGNAALADDLNESQKTVLLRWLISSDVDANLAEEMLSDEQFRLELYNGLFDRIEEIVSICGSDKLTDENGDTYYIDGEEEKGFSSERSNLKIEKQISVDTQVNPENTVMKTTLMIEGKKKLSIAIGYDDLSSIVSSLPDSPDFEEVFNVLAAHPSATVRESIAGKDKINEETVNMLAADSDAIVIRALVRSDAARDTLTTEQLIEMIKRDVDTAENIAGYVESYNNAEADDIAEALARHSDPRVRNALAGNSSSPKKILKNLLKDEDPRVRSSAKQSLE